MEYKKVHYDPMLQKNLYLCNSPNTNNMYV